MVKTFLYLCLTIKIIVLSYSQGDKNMEKITVMIQYKKGGVECYQYESFEKLKRDNNFYKVYKNDSKVYWCKYHATTNAIQKYKAIKRYAKKNYLLPVDDFIKGTEKIIQKYGAINYIE
jgi:hypothetical protein